MAAQVAASTRSGCLTIQRADRSARVGQTWRLRSRRHLDIYRPPILADTILLAGGGRGLVVRTAQVGWFYTEPKSTRNLITGVDLAVTYGVLRAVATSWCRR